MLISVALYDLLLILSKTFMFYYRLNKVLTHYNILIGVHCLIDGIELSLATSYLSPYCLIRLLLPYLSCHYLTLGLIASFRLSLPHFGYYRLTLAVTMIFVSHHIDDPSWQSYIHYGREYGFDTFYWIMEFGFPFLLCTS